MDKPILRRTLDRFDWISAGFRALALGGPSAIRVEPIARGLKATKGSFYWHFRNLEDLKQAMLEQWYSLVTEDLFKNGSAVEGDARDKLRQWAGIAGNAAIIGDFGGFKIEPAIRDWARVEQMAADLLQRADAYRLTYLEDLFQQADVGAELAADKARLLFAASIGLENLSTSGLADINRLLLDLLDALLEEEAL